MSCGVWLVLRVTPCGRWLERLEVCQSFGVSEADGGHAAAPLPGGGGCCRCLFASDADARGRLVRIRGGALGVAGLWLGAAAGHLCRGTFMKGSPSSLGQCCSPRCCVALESEAHFILAPWLSVTLRTSAPLGWAHSHAWAMSCNLDSVRASPFPTSTSLQLGSPSVQRASLHGTCSCLVTRKARGPRSCAHLKTRRQ
jgi:hypothetical protein